MTRRHCATTVLAALVLSLAPSLAGAQLFRAYLSPTGNDANPCNLAAPCRLLPAAIAATAPGGEIWMLESANYNGSQVIVDRSISIVAVPGALGSLVSTGGQAALLINTPGVEVTLRNLVIAPFMGSNVGVNMINGTSLTLENCLISGLQGRGIVVDTAASLRVSDSSIRDNGSFGIHLTTGARATISRSVLARNDAGVVLNGIGSAATSVDIIDSSIGGGAIGISFAATSASSPVKGSIRGSTIFGSSNTGINVVSVTGTTAEVSVSNSIVTGNGIGIVASGVGAAVTVSGNAVSANTTGLSQLASGVIFSPTNNAVRNNNTSDVSGGAFSALVLQ